MQHRNSNAAHCKAAVLARLASSSSRQTSMSSASERDGGSVAQDACAQHRLMKFVRSPGRSSEAFVNASRFFKLADCGDIKHTRKHDERLVWPGAA